jgi:hypothetical protein
LIFGMSSDERREILRAIMPTRGFFAKLWIYYYSYQNSDTKESVFFDREFGMITLSLYIFILVTKD